METLTRWCLITGLIGFVVATLFAAAVPYGTTFTNQFRTDYYGYPESWLVINRIEMERASTPYFYVPGGLKPSERDWGKLGGSLLHMYRVVGVPWLVYCGAAFAIRSLMPRRKGRVRKGESA